MQLLQARLGLGDNRIVALGLAEPDQLDRVFNLALDAAVALNRPFEAGALAQDLLRLGRVVPELRIFRLGVQLGEAPVGNLPVKDASSAAPTTSGCRRRPPVSRRAFVRILCPNRRGLCLTWPSTKTSIPWTIPRITTEYASAACSNVIQRTQTSIQPASSAGRQRAHRRPQRPTENRIALRRQVLARDWLQTLVAILAGLGAGLVPLPD